MKICALMHAYSNEAGQGGGVGLSWGSKLGEGIDKLLQQALDVIWHPELLHQALCAQLLLARLLGFLVLVEKKIKINLCGRRC